MGLGHFFQARLHFLWVLGNHPIWVVSNLDRYPYEWEMCQTCSNKAYPAKVYQSFLVGCREFEIYYLWILLLGCRSHHRIMLVLCPRSLGNKYYKESWSLLLLTVVLVLAACWFSLLPCSASSFRSASFVVGSVSVVLGLHKGHPSLFKQKKDSRLETWVLCL